MNPKVIRHGSAQLRPRARIIRTIGRDLISNETVALVELIKNAYDADASKVRIIFEDPLLPSQGSITIEDDGVGMSLETIQQVWFEPATVSKTQNTTSAKGRRVTGEKGIGRFAAARIAQMMEMESVSAGDETKMVRVQFNWGRFDDQNLYLDQIRCTWEETVAPRGRGHGTVLRLKGLNDVWDADSFAGLRGELSRLVSPQAGKDDFEISLLLPDRFKDYHGVVTPPAIMGKPHYRFTGSVDAAGKLSATYKGPGITESIPISGESLLDGRIPQSGPFKFEFSVWDRDNLEPLADELGSTVRKLRQDLDSACGISIYRNGFRVLLADNDWLRLDLRRVQNPTMRISNNQIVGAVFISADENKGLRDQTNREGIVSSLAFEDFKRTLIDVLSKLEVKRDTYRRGKRVQKQGIGVFQALSITPLKEYLENRYPQDMELKAFLGAKVRTFEHGVAEVQQVLARYRRLATLGQLIDVVLHEGRTPVAAISNEVVLARRDIDRGKVKAVDATGVQQRLITIGQQAEFLSALFKRLAPFSGRKRGRPVVASIEEMAEEAFALFEKKISDLHVNVALPKTRTMVTVDKAEMQQIFVNLLDNALYWLQRVPDDRRSISVEVSGQARELSILFSDSGPGVPEDIQERIFDPYFSAKPDGVGLGLTIAGETAAEYDGTLELISGGPLPGATFRVTLRRRIGGDQDA